ncbi:hypothetical protein Hypma_008359, partial [Hypsizygus marmoreus]
SPIPSDPSHPTRTTLDPRTNHWSSYLFLTLAAHQCLPAVSCLRWSRIPAYIHPRGAQVKADSWRVQVFKFLSWELAILSPRSLSADELRTCGELLKTPRVLVYRNSSLNWVDDILVKMPSTGRVHFVFRLSDIDVEEGFVQRTTSVDRGVEMACSVGISRCFSRRCGEPTPNPMEKASDAFHVMATGTTQKVHESGVRRS